MQGYNNEYNFVLEFNNKKVNELSIMCKELVYSIFNNIKDDDLIKCWRNYYDQKTDVFLKIGKSVKGISIKMGSRNSVHEESISKFKKILIMHNIPKDIIYEYLKFHYADGTINNSGKNRLSALEYKKNNQQQIDNINKYFNNSKIIFDAIDRFVLRGNNSIYSISAIVLGTPDDFLWLTKDDIIKILNKRCNDYCSSPHFSNLVCQSKNRCLNYNKKHERYRNYVQIKWYSLFDNIIEQMNDNIINNKNLDNFQS